MIPYGNSVKFKETWFDIPGDGITFANDSIRLMMIKGDTTIEQFQELVTPVPETINIYDEDRLIITGSYSGYTQLQSITILYNQKVYRNEMYADMLEVVFCLPTLEERVDANEAQTFYTAMMTDTLLEEEE